MKLRAEILSPEEAFKYLGSIERCKRIQGDSHCIHIGFGMALKGSAKVTCRDVKTGKIDWEQELDNVITDYGRRVWFQNGFRPTLVVACPNVYEDPNFQRYSLSGPADANSNPTSGSTTGVWNSGTSTKTWTPSAYGVPSSNRTIGTIALGTYSSYSGINPILAYLLMNPPKTQTTIQTLEIVYKVVLAAIS